MDTSKNSSDPTRTKTRYYGYTRKFEYDPTKTPKPFAQDYIAKKTSELQFANASKAYYYSEATNALWSANISGNGATSQINLKEIPSVKKYLALKSEQAAPRKETFSNPGEVSEYLIPPAFQKFQFAFHPDFSETTSKSENTFAYIDNNNNVQVYRKGNWFNLELGVVEGEAVAIQLTRSPLNQKESDLTVITKTSDRYYIYTFEYQDPYHIFVRNSLYSQKSFEAKDYTAFYYDISKKLLYAAERQELPNKRFKARIITLRFNGSDQNVYQKEFLVYQKNKAGFVSSYENQGYTLDEETIANGAVTDNFIQSLSVDTINNSLTFIGTSEIFANDYEPRIQSVQEAVIVKFNLQLLNTK